MTDRLAVYVLTSSSNYDPATQLRQLQEELAEVIVAASHLCRHPDRPKEFEDLACEIADVELMIACVKHSLGLPDRMDLSLDRAEAQLP